MYTAIRHYRVKPEPSSEIVGAIIENFAPSIVEKIRGLLDYYVVDGEDGSFATVTICDSREALEECSELAAQWMKQYLLKSISQAEDLNDLLLEVGPIVRGPLYIGALAAKTERSPRGVKEEPPHTKEGQGPELLTPTEVARMLRMSKSWVYQRIEKGEIPSVRLGNNIKVEYQNLQEYLKAQQHSEPDYE